MNQSIPPDDLLDPKNDYVFKRLFAEAPALLAALINAVRSDKPPVEVVEVLNPRIEPDEITGKFIVLDILVKDQHGRLFNVEMQIRRFDPWSARSTYYLARALSGQISSGEDYFNLKPVIGIHLLDFDLFDQPENANQAQWCFELRDRNNPQVKLGDELKLHIIELSKADRLGHTQGPLADWIKLFEHWQEDNTMQTIDYPPVQQALDKLKGLSADEETRRMAFVRERAMMDESSALRAATERGLQQGMQQGKREEATAILARLLTKRFGPLSEETRVRLSEATLDQLDLWADRILDAPSVTAVFDGH
ncbi:Rpn family recombination-promoting nuclease/putative transposase [Magnetovirga frankeli]|uniref:Rpn family recombination-promoting nuclease/putative transposase n=1 Tax=Magnetovirga frankeli TaxID=947516 RepID=UPI0012938844|nr:Rpn family recombination-promoting nuclease/putative transposase [gamma proteobacterium SS-5]